MRARPKGFDASGLGAIFWLLIGALLILVTPLRAFNELAAERKANTLELIFMSGLSAWRIAFGKWVSLLFQALLFLLAVLPYAIMRYYFGAVDLAQDLHGMLDGHALLRGPLRRRARHLRHAALGAHPGGDRWASSSSCAIG